MINVTKDVESINPSLLKLKTQFPNSLQKLDIGKLVHSQHMYRKNLEMSDVMVNYSQ